MLIYELMELMAMELGVTVSTDEKYKRNYRTAQDVDRPTDKASLLEVLSFIKIKM